MSEETNQPEPDKIPHESGSEGKYRVGYKRPPIETRFQPGNPGSTGRKTAGATVKEWQNYFSMQKMSETDLRKIARDKNEDWNRRTAANQMLRTLECPDISDYSGLLSGENRIEDLRAMGINTEVVKKLKQRTRRTSMKDGNIEEIVERDIEFYDRAGENFDRVCDRTDGKPTQSVEVVAQVNHSMQDAMKRILANGEAFETAKALASRITPNGEHEDNADSSGN
jgi:hypothetical protein